MFAGRAVQTHAFGLTSSNGQADEITDTLRSNVRLIIDSPEDLLFECFPSQEEVTVRIPVAPTDLGKIIGKQSTNARACGHLQSRWERPQN
jgi:predicted RNA-binding protein YlqC (UPF0109 family)